MAAVCPLVRAQEHAAFETDSETPPQKLANARQIQAEIERFCLKPNFTQATCVHLKGQTRLDRGGLMGNLAPAFAASTAILKATEGVGTCYANLMDPKKPANWLEREIENDFTKLKCALAQKATREKLKDCQKACLATCVSSRILFFDKAYMPKLQTPRQAICSRHGVCRDFTNVALEFMQAQGLNAQVLTGTGYDIEDNEKVPFGPHAMIGININKKLYVMEPQHTDCTFEDSDFAKAHRAPTIEYLENTKPQ